MGDEDNSGDIRDGEVAKLLLDIFPEETFPDMDFKALLNQIDTSSDGTLDFDGFVRLIRTAFDMEDEKRIQKELRAVKDCCFSLTEVQEFRKIFVAQDWQGVDCLSFDVFRWMIHRICNLSEKFTQDLRNIWNYIVERNDMATDFPDFLRLMKHLLDIDFAGIRDHT